MSLTPNNTDAAPWHESTHQDPSVTDRITLHRHSQYVTMRDGVRLAVDVHLPADLEPNTKVPTILRQTRYFRGLELRRWAEKLPMARQLLETTLDRVAKQRRRFAAHGYAWVDVCVRGTGASFGNRPCPWSPDEIADGAEIVNWVIKQPWSNGLVGATGVSYEGTTADMLLVNGHPAVRAIAPRFSLFDVYTDIAFPGGIHLAWFTEQWSRFNRHLDANALDAAFGLMAALHCLALAQLRPPARRNKLEGLLKVGETATGQALASALLRLACTGVRRVDEDLSGALLAQAIVEHADNVDVHAAAQRLTYRDDIGLAAQLPDRSIDYFSPHSYRERLRASGAAIYSYSGWLDGAYQNAAIKRFLTLRDENSRLLLGPWDHGGGQNISPYSSTRRCAFDHDGELLRFFDHHLQGRDNGFAAQPAVRYFTVGQEQWKAAANWPPAESRTKHWYLAPQRCLTEQPPTEQGVESYRVDAEAGTGHRSRFDSLLGILTPIGYGDRAQQGRRSLVYRSAPLAAPLEITGHPWLSLYVTADSTDAHLFAYLEDELPNGEVYYVTEGQLRALHRELSDDGSTYRSAVPQHSFVRAAGAPLRPGEPFRLQFDLLPISWCFDRGHRLRLALAGADRDHFAVLQPTPTLGIHHGAGLASRLELPVAPNEEQHICL